MEAAVADSSSFDVVGRLELISMVGTFAPGFEAGNTIYSLSGTNAADFSMSSGGVLTLTVIRSMPQCHLTRLWLKWWTARTNKIKPVTISILKSTA